MQGQKLVDKPHCEMCGIIENGAELQVELREYHEHKVCDFCLLNYWIPYRGLYGFVEWDELPDEWKVGHHGS